jgi:hypothetical protein
MRSTKMGRRVLRRVGTEDKTRDERPGTMSRWSHTCACPGFRMLHAIENRILS